MSVARQVSEALAGVGLGCYVPIKPIWESEAQWDDELIEEIRSADGVVFVEPETDIAAGHVLFEIGAARALGKKIVGVCRRSHQIGTEETVSETILHSFEIIDAQDMDDGDLAQNLKSFFV